VNCAIPRNNCVVRPIVLYFIRKRFEKAETEYISAKMELHMRTSRKEDLTEHLYHLIQANEERKAR